MKRKGKIVEAKIESKDQRWHTRNRIQLTFGSNDEEELETFVYESNRAVYKTVNFHQAKSKAIEELIDNSIDEFYRGHVSEIKITLKDNNKRFIIEDNGIGFPLSKIVPVYSEYRTGSKFNDSGVDKNGFLNRTIGQNGLGASATCLTADLFRVTVKHYNTKKEQTVDFIDGALKIKNSSIKSFKGDSGVRIEVILSEEVYKNNTLDPLLIEKRIRDLSMSHPGLTFIFNGKKIVSKNGLNELAKMIDPVTGQELGKGTYVHDIEYNKKKVKAQYDLSFSIAFDLKSHENERFISFVNSTPTYDGGFHHDKARRAFINAVKIRLEKDCKKFKLKLLDSDITSGVSFVLGITMPNPRFESQTKRKLVKDYPLEKSINQLIEDNIQKFFKKNKDFLENIIEKAKSRNKYQEMKDAANIAKKNNKLKIDKLLDANERKHRSQCSLFICEGDSAIGGLRSSRDKNLHGGIALKGKPLNVSQATVSEVIKNQEFLDIMGSIGLTIGEKVDYENLRFHRIVFLADSDVDGGHINTLLTNFFFKFWPELFEKGMIQVAKAPLFEIITTTQTYFAESEEELAHYKNNNKIKIKEIHRNKGLGEMSSEAWKFIMSKKDYTKIVYKNKKDGEEILEICFGKDTQLRKDLLVSKSIKKGKS